MLNQWCQNSFFSKCSSFFSFSTNSSFFLHSNYTIQNFNGYWYSDITDLIFIYTWVKWQNTTKFRWWYHQGTYYNGTLVIRGHSLVLAWREGGYQFSHKIQKGGGKVCGPFMCTYLGLYIHKLKLEGIFLWHNVENWYTTFGFVKNNIVYHKKVSSIRISL